MLDLLFAGGQAVRLLGLVYGVCLAFSAGLAPRTRPRSTASAGSGFLLGGAP